jgi:hypothetical protein
VSHVYQPRVFAKMPRKISSTIVEEEHLKGCSIHIQFESLLSQVLAYKLRVCIHESMSCIRLCFFRLSQTSFSGYSNPCSRDQVFAGSPESAIAYIPVVLRSRFQPESPRRKVTNERSIVLKCLSNSRQKFIPFLVWKGAHFSVCLQYCVELTGEVHMLVVNIEVIFCCKSLCIVERPF